MGNNKYGRLGQNSKTYYSSPVQVPGGTWSKACNAEGVHALKTDGTLWGWGNSGEGRLGQNNNSYIHHQFKYLVLGVMLMLVIVE